jgi:hypothetical protein
MTLILNALGAFALGAVGWFTLEFFGRPIREFFSIRREIKRLMLLYWSEDSPSSDVLETGDFQSFYESLEPARTGFSNLAAQVIAFHQAEWLASWFVKLLGFDLPKAGNTLRELRFFGVTNHDSDKTFQHLDRALRFRFDQNRPFYNPYNPGR